MEVLLARFVMLTQTCMSTWSGTPWPFAFMLFSAMVSWLGRDWETDRVLTSCHWKQREIPLDKFSSGEVKLMKVLSRAKSPYNSLFSFYVHRGVFPFYLLHVYIFVICDRWTEYFLVTWPILKTVHSQTSRLQKVSESRPSFSEQC